RRPRRSYPAAQGGAVRRRPAVPIKGILFDKDGTLVDFHATWSAVADLMALEAAGGDRPAADRLLGLAGYDADAGHFTADSVFAAGTNRDIVDLWFPDLPRQRQDEALARFDAVCRTESARVAVALPGAPEALA